MEQHDYLPPSDSHFQESIGISWWLYFGLGLFLFLLQYLARKKKWEDKKKVLIELAFLASALVPVFLFILISVGTIFFKLEDVSIPIHDTYLVFSKSAVIIQLWIFSYFIFSLLRQIWLRFQRKEANLFLIGACCLLLLILWFYNMVLTHAVGPGSILIPFWSAVAFISAVGIIALIATIRLTRKNP